jgi:uncharacterized protein
MKIVIDTNCLLSCIGKKSLHRKVFDAFLTGKYILCASSEILLEYEEKFIEFWNIEVATNLLALFETSENFEEMHVYYNWQLVSKNEDDNKFADAYIAANADFLVSNNRVIRQLKSTSFPPMNILTLQEFSNLLS